MLREVAMYSAVYPAGKTPAISLRVDDELGDDPQSARVARNSCGSNLVVAWRGLPLQAGALARVEHQANVEVVSVARFGFWVALATGISTLVTFGIAVATPPLSGPLCREGCLSYPYLDVASRFPRDYVWLFPAILATLLYVGFVIALRARAAGSGALFGELGLSLSVMAALTLVGDYFVQLAVVQPALRAGEADGIALLSQYNPHGLFIALEELGYLLLSLSLVCLIPTLSSSTRVERIIRRLFLTGFVANFLALCWFLLRYGHEREYHFEIAVISIDWSVLIAGAFLAAVVFHRDLVVARR
jgi:hypothetical protein